MIQMGMWRSGEVSPSGRCCSREILIIIRFDSGYFPRTKAGATLLQGTPHLQLTMMI